MAEATCSKKIERYMLFIEKKIREEYTVAGGARKKGFDPEKHVEVLLARDLSEKVEGLISVVAPQIIGSGVAQRIKELEKKYNSLDWRIALTIALEIAKEKFCKFKNKKEAMEVGIRAGFAYVTTGTVSSPLEGFVELTLKKRMDGGEYFALRYSGPVRSAGGTAAAVSVIIADYIRKEMGYSTYDPTENEIKRMTAELYDFHEKITNLQYLPSREEIEFLTRHLPVQIDGDPSEKYEVSNYKDLPRVETNFLRNGVCLVIGECLAQKAQKLLVQLTKWGEEFGLEDWKFLGEFVDLQKKIKSHGQKMPGEKKISPDFTYIKDIVAGRPVISHPLREGGLRLRYGRARTSGFSSTAINPATMAVLNEYLATGTQLKLERPGKATSLTTCGLIDGPIVKLNDESVLQLNSIEEAKTHKTHIKEILYLGDILINYGDFFNRGHPLVPAGYCPEWWIQELEKNFIGLYGTLDIGRISEVIGLPKEKTEALFNTPLTTKISAQTAIQISQKTATPLHPSYTYYWNALNKDQLAALLDWLLKANYLFEDNILQKIVLQKDPERKRLLEIIGLPHIVSNNEFLVVEKNHAQILQEMFERSSITDFINKIKQASGTTVDIINSVSQLKIRDKSGTFIGARMGRPEKAKMRALTGSPHGLFPVGTEGGRLRCVKSALEAGGVTSNFAVFQCPECKKETIFPVCENCNKPTKRKYVCKKCGLIDTNECKLHGKASESKLLKLDIAHYFNKALAKLNMKVYPDLIKGVKGTSNKEHIPEHLAKGILRAKHDIYVNKDGTCRYDITQLPITHFKPKETNVPIAKLRALGYDVDIAGKELENENQILELLPQDIILPSLSPPFEGADKFLLRSANFIDDLLQNFYGLDSYYNFQTEEDIVGSLVLCLAPHTSVGIVGRVIGFSKTQGFFAHPMFHSAMRRDCDGDEACVTLLLDVLVNFSRHFLPAHRGSTQDAPLVLTSRLVPAEVDDMVFHMDVVWKYPLELYEAALDYKPANSVQIERLGARLNTPLQYENMGFTHDVSDINDTIKCSAYKTLPSMKEKLDGQMDIAAKVRAVDKTDVAKLVIEKHFIKDTKGNLRKFSTQEFRCVNCNEKYRRPPLIGRCLKCKGRIIFTVSEGAVVKYLEPTISLAQNYNISPYLKQSIDLLKMRIESVFGREKEKQTGLTQWFS